jgi:hypothetical protein
MARSSDTQTSKDEETVVTTLSELPEESSAVFIPRIPWIELRSDVTVLLEAVGYCKYGPEKCLRHGQTNL